jgi:hypothetical protein
MALATEQQYAGHVSSREVGQKADCIQTGPPRFAIVMNPNAAAATLGLSSFVGTGQKHG